MNAILNAIDKALAPTPPPRQDMPEGRQFPSFNRTNQDAPPHVPIDRAYKLAVAGLDVCTAAELQELRELQAKWQQYFEAQCLRFDRAAARQEFARRYRAAWDEFNLNGKDIADAPAISEESVLAEFEAKAQFANRARAEVEAQSLTACAPVAKRFVEIASAELNRLEKRERDEADKFGMPYVPSPRAATLRQLIARIQANNRRPTPAAPATLLPFLDL